MVVAMFERGDMITGGNIAQIEKIFAGLQEDGSGKRRCDILDMRTRREQGG